MKKLISTLLLGFLLLGCDDDLSKPGILGKWKNVKKYDPMVGHIELGVEDQNIEEYRLDKRRILYDYQGNETARTNYKATETEIILWGEPHESWQFVRPYRFQQDSLVIKFDAEVGYYEGYYVRID